MARVFKNMRRKLASKNKTAAYLRYAIGEIILVVFGILIALQVNNWNKSRQIRATEQAVLKSLLKEFQHNQQLLAATIQMNKNILSSARQLGKYTGPKLQHVDGKKLSVFLTEIFKWDPNYLPSLGTLLDVINSGKLSIISNQTLRSDLSAFESELNNVHVQERYLQDYQNDGLEFLLKEGNFRKFLYMTKDSTNVTPGRFPHNDFKFLENPEFENRLYIFMSTSYYLDKTFYEPLKEKQDTIVHLIQSEIK